MYPQRPWGLTRGGMPSHVAAIDHSLQTINGGWDQTQYGYWATELMSQIPQFTINRAYVPRAQNAFDDVEVSRIAKLYNRTTW